MAKKNTYGPNSWGEYHNKTFELIVPVGRLTQVNILSLYLPSAYE